MNVQSFSKYCKDFNSIKVQLKPLAGCLCAYMLRYNFNSIKVQLKLAVGKDGKFAVHVFQFHKGTIKTWVDVNDKNYNTLISIP